ncbi:DNRLRE domain-containing protein [Candidatus Pacearchaeota archaeon]|nr:DNRLRE domain-containing protein [Candidatus Pacearchaeota archaeon]
MVEKKKVTLSIDTKIYDDFQKYCEENAIMLSKKIELIMKDMLKNKKKLLNMFLSFFVILVFISLFVGLISSQVFEMGEYWNKYDNGDGNYGLKIYNSILNYNNGTEIIPFNLTMGSSPDPLFDYAVINNQSYDSYFKIDPTAGEVVKYVKDSVETAFQPMPLNYRNALDMIEQISSVQSVSGIPNNNTFIYPQVYGSGIDLRYDYLPEGLKERLVINDSSDLPTPAAFILGGGNVTLDLDFIYDTNAQHIFMEGIEWDKTSQTITKNEIYIKDNFNNTIYYFSKPYAYDSNGSRISLTYLFKKQGNKLYINLKTNYSWLNESSRVFPVYIDPSIMINISSGGADSYVGSGGDSSKNFGDLNIIKTGAVARGYLRFNISEIPINQKIDDAMMCIYLTTKKAQSINVSQVYEDWSELGIIWNNQPCGTNFDNSSACNLTAESFLQMNATFENTWRCWDVKDMVGRAYNDGNKNVSMALYTSNSDVNSYNSKEHSTVSLRPYIDINYSLADIVPPSFSNYSENPVNGSSYSPFQFYEFNVTLTEENLDTIGIEFNGVNYSGGDISNIGDVYIFNRSDLAAGTYSYYWWAYDIVGNSNVSEVRSYSVLKATPSVSFLLNGASDNITIDYLQSLNASASTDGGSVNMFRDGVDKDIENGLNVILGAGYYEYKANVTGNQNYSDSGDVILYVNVSKADPSGNMQIIISPSENVSYNTSTQASATESNIGDNDLTHGFFRNNVLIDNFFPWEESSPINLSAGTYYYIFNTTGGANYTMGSVNATLIVNQLNNPVSLLLNDINDNVSITYGNSLNASSSSTSGIVSLFRDSENVTDENGMNVLLGGGNYEYFVNSSGSLNYLANVSGERFFVTVDQASSDVNLYLNHSQNNISISLSDSLEINSSLINGSGNISVYINESLDYFGNSPYYNLTSFPAPGIYNLTVIYENNQNYTRSSETFFVDVSDNVGPVVNIILPESKTYGYNTSLPLNFSVSDPSGVSSCWYSIDYLTNISLLGCSNITFDLEDDNYILTLYSNDSLGNLGFSEVSFAISTTLAVSLDSPSNGSFIKDNEGIYLNYTVDTLLPLYNCSLYIGNGGGFEYNRTNSSFVNTSGGINSFFVNLSDGNYVWNVRCLAGMYDVFAFSNYSLFVDSVSPLLEIYYPLNNSLINRNKTILFNYSVDDSYLENCWYTFDNGVVNNSLSCGLGLNNLLFDYPAGTYNLSVYSNDSSGNIGVYSVYDITINEDIVAPDVIINQPSGTRTSVSNIPLEFSVSDSVDSLDELTCFFNVSYSATNGSVSGLENVSVIGCLDTTFDVPIQSSYILFLNVIDISGNKNYSNISFSVSTPAPPGPGGGGSSGGGGGSSVSYVPANKNEKNLTDINMPKLSDIIGKEGTKKSLSLKIRNTGDVFLNKCRLLMKGDISSWFYSTQINGISSGETVDYLFDINIPEGVGGDNSGDLIILCDEINKSQIVTVIIPNGLSTIRIGELEHLDSGLDIDYEVDTTGMISEELNVEIWLVDSDGIEYNRINDVFRVEETGTINRNIFMVLPEDLVGIFNIYFAFSDELDNNVKQSVVLGKSVATGFSVLNQPKNKMIIYVIFIFVTFVVVFFIMWGKRKNKIIKGVKLKKVVKR